MADDALRLQREATIVSLLAVEQDLDIERLAQVFPNPRYELIGNNRVYDGLEDCALATSRSDATRSPTIGPNRSHSTTPTTR